MEIVRRKLLEYSQNSWKMPLLTKPLNRNSQDGREAASWKLSRIPSLRNGFPQQKIGINLLEKMEFLVFPAAIQGKKHQRKKEKFPCVHKPLGIHRNQALENSILWDFLGIFIIPKIPHEEIFIQHLQVLRKKKFGMNPILL